MLSRLVSNDVVNLACSFFEILFDKITVWVGELVKGVHVLVLLMFVQVSEEFALSGLIQPLNLDLVEDATSHNSIQSLQHSLSSHICKSFAEHWPGLKNKPQQVNVIGLRQRCLVCSLVVMLKGQLRNGKPNCRELLIFNHFLVDVCQFFLRLWQRLGLSCLYSLIDCVQRWLVEVLSAGQMVGHCKLSGWVRVRIGGFLEALLVSPVKEWLLLRRGVETLSEFSA